MIRWIEPFGPNNEPVYCYVPRETAIAVQKDRESKRGNTYPNDEKALLDFIAIHWAYETEE